MEIQLRKFDMKQIKDAIKILKRYLKNKFILMQCTTDYPAKINEANINVLNEFKTNFVVKRVLL